MRPADTASESRLADLLGVIRRSGHRLTPQRSAIIAALVRHTGHPTVEELHRRILAEFPTTSLATVYKTIGLLKELGEVLELDIAGTGSRFDGRRPRPHPHLVCTRCGCVTDPAEGVESDLKAFVDRLAAQAGHQVQDFSLDIFGLCPKCRKG